MMTTDNDKPATDQRDDSDEQQRQTDELQAELYRRYLEQQRRLACPGCGEEPFLG